VPSSNTGSAESASAAAERDSGVDGAFAARPGLPAVCDFAGSDGRFAAVGAAVAAPRDPA
jgi:hypothetical protein